MYQAPILLSSRMIKHVRTHTVKTMTMAFSSEATKSSTSTFDEGYMFKHFNPTDEHSQLRQLMKSFVEREVGLI